MFTVYTHKHTHTHTHVCHELCMEDDNFMEVCSHFLPGGLPGLNSGFQAWLQVPLTTKPSCCPYSLF